MNLYGNFEGLKEWRNNLQKPHNKIPQDKINRIIELYKLNPDWPACKIAEQVGVGGIKVQRVLKGRNLGKRLVKEKNFTRGLSVITTQDPFESGSAGLKIKNIE